MKRIAIMAAAALTAAGPLASTAYADQGNGYNNNDRDNNGRGNNNRRDNNRRGDNNRRDWDRSRDNGYMLNGRWNFGPPPSYIVGRPGFEPGWHAWRSHPR